MHDNQNPFLAVLKFFEFPLHKQVLLILGVIFIFWIMLCAPTGWIYDLGVGRGTQQGQMPDASVVHLRTQDEVEKYFFGKTPCTVFKEGLIQCPLLHLRDEHYAGTHRGKNKRTFEVSEYCTMSYPIGFGRKAANLFLGSSYNKYYLAPLEDGSYVCVYFDDYLMLRPGKELPTGYVRYADTEEKRMLHTMAKSCDVNPVYVLDLYRHGKGGWIVDFAIRLVTAITVLVAGLTIYEKVEKRRKTKGVESDGC